MLKVSLLLLVLATVLAACAPTQGLPRDDPPPPSESGLRRLEARLVGLTDELDRLSRRVNALEGGKPLPASTPRARPSPPPPTPMPEPEPEPGPDRELPEPPAGWPGSGIPGGAGAPSPGVDPEFPESAGPGRAPSGWTSIVIDARAAKTERGNAPSKAHGSRWRVLDYDGGSVLASEQVPERLLRTRPIFWVLETEATLGAAETALLGARPLEGRADFAEVFVHEDESEEALFYVDAETAKKIRSVPDLAATLTAGNVVVILRKAE